MGWQSTVAITPQDARKKLMSKIMDASDQELERLMDQLYQDSPYNFQIVADYNLPNSLEKFPDHLE